MKTRFRLAMVYYSIIQNFYKMSVKRTKFIFASVLLFILAAAGSLSWNKIKGREQASHPQIMSEVLHYSYFSQKDFYEQAYASAHVFPNPSQPVKGIIVNHHLIGARLIAQAMGIIATVKPVTVVLISPNHYAVGKSKIITSVAAWQTPYGILEPDLQTISKLKNDNLVSVEERPFDQEHGISGIVAFIKKSLPNAKIIPIIVKDNVTVKQARDFAKQFNQDLPEDPIFIGSFDFSHYLTLPTADFHDIESREVIKSLAFSDIDRLDVDSHPGLAILLQLLQERNFQQFDLLEQNNSARIAKRDDILETTSYVTGYFTKGYSSQSETVTMLSYGNFYPDNEVAQALNKNNKNFGFEFLERMFFGQDVTFGTFVGQNQEIGNQLARYGYNNLNEGQNVCKVQIIRSVKIGSCLLNINFGQQSIKSVRQAKLQTDFVVVQVYGQAVSQLQKVSVAHKLVAAGAGTVLFSGNDKIEPLEIYQNKLIVYGQGDNISANSLKSGSKSFIVGLVYQSGQVTADLFPIEIKSGEAKLILPPASGIVLAGLAEKSAVSLEQKQQIKNGQIKLTNLNKIK